MDDEKKIESTVDEEKKIESTVDDEKKIETNVDDEKKIDESNWDERLSFFIAAWVKALESMKVGELVGDNPREPIILSTKLSLEGAVDALSTNNLKSAPVYGEDGNCVGMLNMGSVLKYSIRTKKNANWLFGVNFLTTLTDVKYPLDVGQDAKRNDVAYLARMKRFNTVDVNQSLLELGQQLSGTPAVGVTDEGKLISIISQGHFVKAMNKFGWLDEQNVTLGDLIEANKCPTKVDSCLDEITTYNAFFEMARLNRSAMAVLQKDSGDFLGSVNLMDTTAFVDLPDHDVDTKVSEYLQKQKQPALVCDRRTRVVDAMSKICSKQSNRIWVLEDGKAVAICSLTDVLALVSNK